MNIRIEVENFEHKPKFEKTINDIKYNYPKSIASTAMNLSDINLIDKNLEQIGMNNRIEVEKFEPETTFEKNINEIKANNLKSITSIDINLSAFTLEKPYISSQHL